MAATPLTFVLACLTAVAAAQTPTPVPADRPQQAPHQHPQPARPLPVPKIVAPKRTSRIDVDGSLDDWPTVQPIQLSDPLQISGSALGAWRGPSDLAAVAFVTWDDKYLWFGAKVRDDWHRPLGPSAATMTEIPPADGIMLTIDPDRDTRALGNDPGRREDREYWFAEVVQQGHEVVHWDRLRGTARFVDGANLVVLRDPREQMTTYEARLPWTDILPPGRTPSPRMVFDMQIVVDDFDEVTDTMPQTRIGWTFGCGPRIDPGLFGSVMLVEELVAGEALPEFPSPPTQKEDPVPPRAWWVRLAERLRTAPPRATAADTGAAEELAPPTRLQALRDLEDQLAAFPRTDFLQYQYRIHRRMRRETDGIAASGLPYFWQHVLNDVKQRIAEPAPEKGFRLFRLPQGGWIVRSATANFAIDAAGLDIEQHVWGAIDFTLSTSPLDASKRNDQLLIRQAAAKRTMYMHVAVHLPGLDASTVPLVDVGGTYTTSGLKVDVVGRKDEEGRVTSTIGYRITWPDGAVLWVTSLAPPPDEVGADLKTDVLLLSPRNADAAAYVARTRPALVVFDDVLQCASWFGASGRVPLQDAFSLQNSLRPVPTVILGPGESIDSPR